MCRAYPTRAVALDRHRAALVFFNERACPLNQYVRELASETTRASSRTQFVGRFASFAVIRTMARRTQPPGNTRSASRFGDDRADHLGSHAPGSRHATTSSEARELAAELAALIADQATPPLLDSAQAAAILNVPRSWIAAEARAGRIPHVRLGRYVRFNRDDLIAWCEGRAVGPRPKRRMPV
jgi:excisionase family DNA binding protein